MSRPLIPDPQAVPVLGIDTHLPAVPPDRLTAQALRERFARTTDWQHELPGDGHFGVERAPAQASVLIALIQRESGLNVLLTQRTDHLRSHAGQISFPGGRAETCDADATATALREAHEEVGLTPAEIDVIGTLPVYATVTSFRVTPVVGLVRSGFTLVLDAFEVAEAFEVPLAYLMDPANHHRHQFEAAGASRQFLSMPWRASDATGARRYFIWGATAAMLRNLYRFLSA